MEYWGRTSLQYSNTPIFSHGYGLTAVDDQGMAGNERSFVGNQEEHAVGDDVAGNL